MELDVSDLIGVPFVPGGRDIASGLDCWGLFMVVMGRIGHEVPDYRVTCFDSSVVGEAAREALRSRWSPALQAEEGVGITLALDPGLPGVAQHFGVAINKYRFIHTLESTGCIVSDFDHRFWRSKIVGMYRWTG